VVARHVVLAPENVVVRMGPGKLYRRLMSISKCPTPPNERCGCSDMMADSNSTIAWNRVQLRNNRDALKRLETARFRIGDIVGTSGETQKAITQLKRKIAQSERCIADHEATHQAARRHRPSDLSPA